MRTFPPAYYRLSMSDSLRCNPCCERHNSRVRAHLTYYRLAFVRTVWYFFSKGLHTRCVCAPHILPIGLCPNPSGIINSGSDTADVCVCPTYYRSTVVRRAWHKFRWELQNRRVCAHVAYLPIGLCPSPSEILFVGSHIQGCLPVTQK